MNDMAAARYLRTPEAAEYLGLSYIYLCKLRGSGLGPAYSKVGSGVRYAIDDLDAWMAARRVRSTSEASRLAG